MVQTRGATTAAISKFEQDAKNWNLDKDDFDVFECIGEGGEGCVYRATHKDSGVHVALKRIPDDDYWDEQESRIHCQLMHANIVRMYGMFCDDDATWIILEYCPEGTMMQVMSSAAFAGNKSKEAFVAKAVYALLHAVKYMHQQHHILHRDIKPINVLWKDGTPKLADFGMSAELEESSSHRTKDFAGTVVYMAPEVLSVTSKYRLQPDKADGDEKAKTEEEEQQHGYSYEADSWSLGVTTFELLTGHHPFPIRDESKFTQEIRGYIEKSFSPQNIQFPDHVSDEAKQFILSLVHVQPEERLSVDEALAHAWIRRHVKQHHHLVSSHDKENNHAKQKATTSKNDKNGSTTTSDDGGGVKDVEALLGGLNLNAV